MYGDSLKLQNKYAHAYTHTHTHTQNLFSRESWKR